MKNKFPPLNALRAFEVTARTGSLTRAAQELSVTQGAVSRQVSLLEQWLHVELFVRTRRGADLTVEGEAYYRGIQRAFEEIDTHTRNLMRRPTENTLRLKMPPSRAIRQAEVGSARTMLDRTQDRFGLWPARLAADSAYDSAESLAWLVHERGMEPHIPVFDKSQRSDGTFSRSDFTYDHERDCYTCPGGKELHQYRRRFGVDRDGIDPEGFMRYRASKFDCDACSLKPQCCPNTPARKILRSIHEGARDMARDIAETDAYITSRRERKKVEMLFAHLKRILKLDRLRLRGPNGAKDEFHLAATAQNLRKLAKLLPAGPRIRPV